MCNLYSMTKTRDALVGLFGISHNRAAAFEPLPAIFPGNTAPVIRAAADGERELVLMSWGFVLPQQGKAPRRVTNTRDDKVLSSQFWKRSFQQRRCLVPASSFCEPHDGRKPATWHWFALKGAEPRPAFAFAGLWRRWHGQIKKDGPVVDIETYSFMTTVPNEMTASINHERSPVLLSNESQWSQWLNGTPEEAVMLVNPISADRLQVVREGFDKLDPVA
jgi:putative SOS response-associated peptidase YedK